MGDTARPVKAVRGLSETNARAARGAGRAPSETATLVCAVSLAVALGVGCGMWVNARLTSAASAAPPAPARLLPAAVATGPKTPETPAVAESRAAEHDDASPAADKIAPPPDSGGPTVAEASRTNPAATADRASASKRAASYPRAADGARESASADDAARSGGATGVEKRATADKKATAGQGRAAPCALYASAGSLTIRSGGAATLVLGGPGEAGRVAVATPDWADIAVFSEGRTGGNGWLKYSVRSVSKRPGVYTVRFTTPCGSQTIPVTVTRP